MIKGWFLIIVITSLNTDQALRNVWLDLDLNCLKLGEPCIYHKGWLIIPSISSFVGHDLDLNYLNNSNLDKTRDVRSRSPLCALRQLTCFVHISFRIPLKDIVLAMKARLYVERRRPICHCAITSQNTLQSGRGTQWLGW